MSRQSAEERSASYFRAGKKPPEPTRGMTPAARRIWRDIVSGKPVDWFDSGSLPMLRIHCENIASANRVSRERARVRPGSAEFRAVSVEMKNAVMELNVTSRQLRLTVQHTLDNEDMKTRERGVLGGATSDLIGGPALKVVR
jgi:hypothetical protein